MEFRNFQIEQRLPGVMTVVFDMPDRPVNVFDEGLLRELAILIARLDEYRAANLVVFRSGKPSGFFAGADVDRIRQIRSPEEAETILRAGQELFGRLAALPMMTVAVIHGPCLGGGLEFALACGYRVARDDASTRIGFPEVQLGVIPGWGGTQLLPRLTGMEAALRLILEGQRLPPSKAKTLGLVDMIAPPDRFEAELDSFLVDRLAGKPLRRPRRSLLARLRDETRAGRWLINQIARRRIARQARHYPALPAALRAVEVGLSEGPAQGLAAERTGFRQALFTPTCRNLLELFFQRERARKPETWIEDAAVTARPLDTVAVVGAGTMGAGIAQLAAYYGLAVVLKDIRPDLVEAGVARVSQLMHDAVRAGAISPAEAAGRLRNVSGTVEWGPLLRADLAIEAVIERPDVKREVFRTLDEVLPAGAIIVSNTSALSIDDIAAATRRGPQIAGLHFFNPVHRMPLVEVVRTAVTSGETVATLVEFVRGLGKVPIVVRDAPGFLVNRILFPYFDEAVRLVCEGASAGEIDRAMRRFGMPMGPLELLDQIGIDVAADVARSLAKQAAEPGPSPQRLAAMVEQGRLGKKSGSGFHDYRSPWRRAFGPVIETFERAIRRTSGSPKLPVAIQFKNSEMVGGITQRPVLALINAAAQSLAERVVDKSWMIDLAMVLGTGFAPFRGGPLKLADAWGIDRVVAALDRLKQHCGPRFGPCGLLAEMAGQGRSFYSTSVDSNQCESTESSVTAPPLSLARDI